MLKKYWLVMILFVLTACGKEETKVQYNDIPPQVITQQPAPQVVVVPQQHSGAGDVLTGVMIGSMLSGSNQPVQQAPVTKNYYYGTPNSNPQSTTTAKANTAPAASPTPVISSRPTAPASASSPTSVAPVVSSRPTASVPSSSSSSSPTVSSRPSYSSPSSSSRSYSSPSSSSSGRR